MTGFICARSRNRILAVVMSNQGKIGVCSAFPFAVVIRQVYFVSGVFCRTICSVVWPRLRKAWDC
jgi:hypothetical protein